MTDSKPTDPLELFYYNYNLVSTDDKIKGLEKQGQLFPCHSMNKEERLRQLEFSFKKMMNAYNENSQNKEASRSKWKQRYNQVEDKPITGNASILGNLIKLEREPFINEDFVAKCNSLADKQWNSLMEEIAEEYKKGT